MPCSAEDLRQVPLFSLLDDDEIAVLAAHVEVRQFAPRQRIYKTGDPGDKAYVMIDGHVRVTTIDEDHQEVVVDEPTRGEFFGFASMLDQTPHQTTALATEPSVCVEVDRSDIEALLQTLVSKLETNIEGQWRLDASLARDDNILFHVEIVDNIRLFMTRRICPSQCRLFSPREQEMARMVVKVVTVLTEEYIWITVVSFAL